MAKTKLWLVLRICIVLAPVLGALFFPDRSRAPEWQALVTVPIVFGIAVFMWITIVSQRRYIEFKEPFSLTLPFYPFKRYAIRFLALCAIVMLVAGVSRAVASLVLYQRMTGNGSMLLAMGISILVAVLTGIKLHNKVDL